MITYLAIAFGVSVLGLGALVLSRSGKTGNIQDFNSSRTHARRQKLQLVQDYVTQHESINNDQVQKLLSVSHATAARYLSQLVEANVIKKQGSTGRGVYYVKK